MQKNILFRFRDNIFNSVYYIEDSIQEVESIRDLVIVLNNKWPLEEQIHNVVSKSSKNLGIIKKLTSKFTTLGAIIYLFKALIMPTLTYAYTILPPFTQTDLMK